MYYIDTRFTDEKEDKEFEHLVCSISVRKYTPHPSGAHLLGLVGRIILSTEISSGSCQTEIFFPKESNTETMPGARGASKRTVECNAEYTHNNDKTMTVNKMKLAFIRQ